MKLITKQQRVQEDMDSWDEMYPDKEKRDRLLKDTFRAATVVEAEAQQRQVSAYFGACDECGEQKERAVQLGETLDVGSRTVLLCCGCLKEALALLQSPTNTITRANQ